MLLKTNANIINVLKLNRLKYMYILQTISIIEVNIYQSKINAKKSNYTKAAKSQSIIKLSKTMFGIL